ncbi:MAG: cyclic nucleotide-binding domain-containing protein [Desulfobacterales bacterium]|nr:MAG: cyclic nucleotide-binding domain-containing protein [Desulfobacterales bacterium]
MSNYVLSGNLKFLSLGDVLQFLGSNASTGVLHITSKYVQDPGLIYFDNGNPINAQVGPLLGLDAVNSLFGWADGEFEFSEEDVTAEVVIKKSRMEIILDGLSMLDDGQIEKVGPLSFEEKSSDVSGITSTLPVIRGPLVDYMYVVDEEEAYAGTNIVKEGKHGSWFWVILEGVAEIYRETPKGPLEILRIGEGAFIGSVASLLLLEGNVRSTTIIAVDNVQLGVIDFRRLSVDFLRMSNELRNITISLDRRLRQITDMVVNLYLKKVRTDDYIEGKEQLIHQGESEENLFAIQEGEVNIVRHTENGYVPLSNLYAGDFFGHVPFLDIGQEPYSASVFASEDLETSKLDAGILQKEFDQLSATFRHLIEFLATTVSATTLVASDIQKKVDEQNV